MIITVVFYLCIVKTSVVRSSCFDASFQPVHFYLATLYSLHRRSSGNISFSICSICCLLKNFASHLPGATFLNDTHNTSTPSFFPSAGKFASIHKSCSDRLAESFPLPDVNICPRVLQALSEGLC